MDSRKISLLRTMILMTVSLILISCQDTIPNRATITPDQYIEAPPLVCPTGQHIEKDTAGKESCVADVPVRPTDAITFKQDNLCGCKDGKPVTFGNCTNFCADKATSGASVLYASFSVLESISLNTTLGNVTNWCSIPLEGEAKNPKCLLETKDEAGVVRNLDVILIANSNSIKVDISSLPEDKTFLIKLFEQESKAKSNTVQIIKDSTQIDVNLLGTLKVAPISQFTCIIRSYQTQTTQPSGSTDYFYTFGYRRHYYFLPNNAPEPLQGVSRDAFCHDIQKYGVKDDATYPRLETLPATINLWDSSDPRFFDNNGNTYKDVNDVIVQKTKNFGRVLDPKSNYFNEFKGLQLVVTNPSDTTTTPASTTQLALGYYMLPWIDTTSNAYKSFCLNSTHYNSNDPLFKAFRDVLGLDTEGLYIAEKAAETITTADKVEQSSGVDYLLIRETDLKAVWFYVKNGVLTKPTDDTVANVTTYFYYPFNKDYPFVKSSTQKLYRVKSARELSGVDQGSTQSGTVGSYPPHDKKIGCIPKL